MSYKCWRILIVEEQCSLHSRISRTLNELGCRALTPVRSFRELLSVTQYSHEPFERFDLMLINANVLAATGIDALRFFQSNAQIRHGVIYDVQRGQARAAMIYASQRRQLSLIRTPDRQTLGPLLEQFDV